MPKLSEAQLVILAAAAQRPDRAVLPFPKTAQKSAAAALKRLLAQGLIAERPTAKSDEVWRKTEAGERLALAVTDAGLTAIGIDPSEGEAAPGSTPDVPAAGLARPRDRRSASTARQPDRKLRQRVQARAEVPAPTARWPAPDVGDARAAGSGSTKLGSIITLLRRSEGATIAEMMVATGWQAHSIRGALSGTLGKKKGLPIASDRIEGRGRVYRIASGA